MKRFYACIAILVAVVFLAGYSSRKVQNFVQDILDVLYQAEESLEQEDYPAAYRTLAYGAERCREIRHQMETILRTDDFTQLEEYLRAACGYLEQGAQEETIGELRRAAVEVERLNRLSRRLV